MSKNRITKAIVLIVVGVLGVVSCTPKGIIPSKQMVDIYYDFYMADAYIESKRMSEIGDSVLIYQPLIEKHGYTMDDYITSVDYYLQNIDGMIKILKGTERRIKDRIDYLNIVHDENSKRERLKRIDSLEFYASTKFPHNGYYRALYSLFYKPDSIYFKSSPQIDSSIFDIKPSSLFLYDTLPSLYFKLSLTNKYQFDTLNTAIDSAKVLPSPLVVKSKKEKMAIKDNDLELIKREEARNRVLMEQTLKN